MAKYVKEVEEILGNEGRILAKDSVKEIVISIKAKAKCDEIYHEYVLKVVNVIKRKEYVLEG